MKDKTNPVYPYIEWRPEQIQFTPTLNEEQDKSNIPPPWMKDSTNPV